MPWGTFEPFARRFIRLAILNAVVIAEVLNAGYSERCRVRRQVTPVRVVRHRSSMLQGPGRRCYSEQQRRIGSKRLLRWSCAHERG